MIINLALYFSIDQLQFEANLVTSRLQPQAVRVQERETFKSRLHNAKELEIEFREQAGIHRDEVILAILVNAWHESRWNPKINNDGILQLTPSGMGIGMASWQRQDIHRTVYRFNDTKRFQDWLEWCRTEEPTPAEMSFEFADDILRPSYQHRKPRYYTAEKWVNYLQPKPYDRGS